jgi:hypothetical protein
VLPPTIFSALLAILTGWAAWLAGVWKEQMQSGALKLRRCYFRSHQKKEAALPEAA